MIECNVVAQQAIHVALAMVTMMITVLATAEILEIKEILNCGEKNKANESVVGGICKMQAKNRCKKLEALLYTKQPGYTVW